MKDYKKGDEILPGVVYEVPCVASTSHRVRIKNSMGYNAIESTAIEHLESIAAELASLRARVPTEWRTGVPDLATLNKEDLLVWKESSTKLGYCRVGETRPSCWDGKAEYMVIPCTPAPEKPKELTVADLPDMNGKVEYVVAEIVDSETIWIEALAGHRRIGFPARGTLQGALQAALDAIAAGKLDRWLGGAA